jgi:hypothetical protein
MSQPDFDRTHSHAIRASLYPHLNELPVEPAQPVILFHDLCAIIKTKLFPKTQKPKPASENLNPLP